MLLILASSVRMYNTFDIFVTSSSEVAATHIGKHFGTAATHSILSAAAPELLNFARTFWPYGGTTKTLAEIPDSTFACPLSALKPVCTSMCHGGWDREDSKDVG